MSPPGQRETAPRWEGGTQSSLAGERSKTSSLPDHLDTDAIAQIGQMVDQGWSPTTAAEAWVGWVQVVAESAADAAVLEVAWESS